MARANVPLNKADNPPAASRDTILTPIKAGIDTLGVAPGLTTLNSPPLPPDSSRHQEPRPPSAAPRCALTPFRYRRPLQPASRLQRPTTLRRSQHYLLFETVCTCGRPRRSHPTQYPGCRLLSPSPPTAATRQHLGSLRAGALSTTTASRHQAHPTRVSSPLTRSPASAPTAALSLGPPDRPLLSLTESSATSQPPR